MADDFRTRTRNFLGLGSLQGAPPPGTRSAYARFTMVGPDTTRAQLLGGTLLYVLLTIFCVALVLGSVGAFGQIVFAILGVLCFVFSMQRVVPLLNGRPDPNADDHDDRGGDSGSAPQAPPTTSRRTGGSTGAKKGGGARRSGDPRRSG